MKNKHKEALKTVLSFDEASYVRPKIVYLFIYITTPCNICIEATICHGIVWISFSEPFF